MMPQRFQSHLPVALRCGRAFAFLACLCGASVRADPAFLAEPAPLFASADTAGTGIAELGVAVEVEPLASEGPMRRVVIRGWTRPGAERVLFAWPGKQVLVARLPRSETGRLVPLEQVTDPETEIAWTRMQLEGWVTAETLSPNRAAIWAAAWDLFAERCTACHERRIPENYSANQWRSHLKVMGPRTGLPAPDQELILTFLQYHASDTIGLTDGK